MPLRTASRSAAVLMMIGLSGESPGAAHEIDETKLNAKIIVTAKNALFKLDPSSFTNIYKYEIY
jgi:hypothetical protein